MTHRPIDEHRRHLPINFKLFGQRESDKIQTSFIMSLGILLLVCVAAVYIK